MILAFAWDLLVSAVKLCGTRIVATNTLNLHDQMYHYLQTPEAAVPAVGAEGYGVAGCTLP